MAHHKSKQYKVKERLLFKIKAQNRAELAGWLEYSYKELRDTIYAHPSMDGHYRQFSIPKKSGNFREIFAPSSELKNLQAKLARLLHDHYKDIPNKKEVNRDGKIEYTHNRIINRNVHAFHKNKSIITNAERHKNKRYVFNIDLKDFFPSIHFGRISGFLQKNINWQLPKEVADTIARMACYKTILPQGSPCSPVISNILCLPLDKALSYLATQAQCDYTRYADDITFSTNLKTFPKDIAVLDENEVWQAGMALRTAIEKQGFIINDQKTRMAYRDSQQTVTGLVVNKKVNVSREYIRYTRVMLHKWITHENREEADKVRKELLGRLSFIYQVRKSQFKKNSNEEFIQMLRSNKDDVSLSLLKKFHEADYFMVNDKPVIIGEGKTDSLYLLSAYSMLKDTLKIPYNFRKYSAMDMAFFSSGETLTSLMSDLSGLKAENTKKKEKPRLLSPYFYKLREEFEVRNTKLNYPIILMFDRDKNNIVNEIEGNNKEPWKFAEPNVYACCIPSLERNTSLAIEDYLSDEFFIEQIPVKHGKERHFVAIPVKTDKDGNRVGVDDSIKDAMSRHCVALKNEAHRKETTKERKAEIKAYFQQFEVILKIIDDICTDYQEKLTE
jgi:RNA-directed DNA polymerase